MNVFFAFLVGFVIAGLAFLGGYMTANIQAGARSRISALRVLALRKTAKDLLFLIDQSSPPYAELIAKVKDAARNILWSDGPYYRHLKRGTYYEGIPLMVSLQACDLSLIHDQADLVLYASVEDSKLYVRHPAEFYDGRFMKVDRAEATAGVGAVPGVEPGEGYVDQDGELYLRRSMGVGPGSVHYGATPQEAALAASKRWTDSERRLNERIQPRREGDSID